MFADLALSKGLLGEFRLESSRRKGAPVDMFSVYVLTQANWPFTKREEGTREVILPVEVCLSSDLAFHPMRAF
jgi:hypothetical protein